MASLSSDNSTRILVDGENTCTAGKAVKIRNEDQPENVESYEALLAIGNNTRFLSEVEWTARKILHDSNQRRRSEALLIDNKARAKKVRDQKRVSKEPSSKLINAESGQALQSKSKTPLANQLDVSKDALQRDALEKEEWLLPAVQKTIARSLPRPPSKSRRRLPSLEVLPPPKSLEAQKLQPITAKDTEEKKKTANIIQELQNSPFFTRNMLMSATRSLRERNGGKTRGKKRSKESIQTQDWTSYPLKTKYRHDDRCITSRFVVPVKCTAGPENLNQSLNDASAENTKLSIHPLEDQLQQRISAAYDRSRKDIQTCLTLHPFITNLHNSWISNLGSLREFQSETMNNGLPFHDSCDNSLCDRRDTAAIFRKESQIQSISLERALRKFHIQATSNEKCASPKRQTVKWQKMETPIKAISPNFNLCDDSRIKWDDVTIPSLTVRAAEASFILSKTLCPGCTYVGDRGITCDTLAKFPLIGDGTCMAMPDSDSTQAAAFLARAGPDSFSPVTVTVSMALERPLVACPLLAVDSTIITPEIVHSETKKLPIPTMMAEYCEILKTPIESNIDAIVPHSMLILNTASDKADWFSKSEEDAQNIEEYNDQKYYAKHRREMSEFTDHGFRCKEMTEPRSLNRTIKTTVFGISEQALTTNTTFFCQPILYHCQDYNTEENLTRKRTYADFRYVLQDPGRNKAGGSLPDTSIFIIRMKAYSVQLVERMYVRALRNQQEEKMRMAGSNRCATIKSVEAVFHHYKQAGVMQQCAESIADIKDLELASTQKAVEIPETLIGADFLKRRVLKIDQCTEKFLEFHSQTSAVGVVEPAQHISHEVDETDVLLIGAFNTLFIEDIQEDSKQYLLSTKLHYGDEQTGDLYNDDAVVLAGASSDTRSLFTDAMLLVRSSTIDYEAIENLLDTYDHRAFDINTRDKYGNTLLLLACQQGGVSKRLCKLFLRRGADINAQNYMGNTALHYLMTYNQSPALAEYMIQRGADDSLLNFDGMTCYEGLSKEDVDDME